MGYFHEGKSKRATFRVHWFLFIHSFVVVFVVDVAAWRVYRIVRKQILYRILLKVPKAPFSLPNQHSITLLNANISSRFSVSVVGPLVHHPGPLQRRQRLAEDGGFGSLSLRRQDRKLFIKALAQQQLDLIAAL